MFEHFSSVEKAILEQRARQIANNKINGDVEDFTSALRCQVGREWYAIPLVDLTAIYRQTTIEDVPGTPPFFKGIANIRGRILPVLGLHELLSAEGINHDDQELIVVSHNDNNVALMVTRVDNVLTYTPTDLETVPEDIQTINVTACLADGTLILDIKAVLSDPNIIIEQ